MDFNDIFDPKPDKTNGHLDMGQVVMMRNKSSNWIE